VYAGNAGAISGACLAGTIPKNEALRFRPSLVALTAARTAAGPRLVADAIADIVAWRRAIIESTWLVIARAALRATLVASRSAILPASGWTLARRPIFIRDRIAEAVRLHSRIGAVRMTRTARVAAGSALPLSLAASACARRTETARSRAARTTARRAARCSATLVAARRAAVEWCRLSGKPGRLVDANLLLRRAPV